MIVLKHLQVKRNNEFLKGCWNSTENKSGKIPVPVSPGMPGEDLYPTLMAINKGVNPSAVFPVEKSGEGDKKVPPALEHSKPSGYKLREQGRNSIHLPMMNM